MPPDFSTEAKDSYREIEQLLGMGIPRWQMEQIIARPTFDADSLRRLMHATYIMQNEDPLYYLQWRSARPGIEFSVLDEAVFNAVRQRMDDDVPAGLLLGSPIIAHVRVNDVRYEIDSTAIVDKSSTIATAEILDVIKGEYVPDCTGSSSVSFKHEAEPASCLEFEYRESWHRLGHGYGMEPSGNLNNWVQEGREYVVFLDFLGVVVDHSSKEYRNVLPISLAPSIVWLSTTGCMYPVVDGCVVDEYDDFGFGTHIPVDLWKQRLRETIELAFEGNGPAFGIRGRPVYPRWSFWDSTYYAHTHPYIDTLCAITESLNSGDSTEAYRQMEKLLRYASARTTRERFESATAGQEAGELLEAVLTTFDLQKPHIILPDSLAYSVLECERDWDRILENPVSKEADRVLRFLPAYRTPPIEVPGKQTIYLDKAFHHAIDAWQHWVCGATLSAFSDIAIAKLRWIEQWFAIRSDRYSRFHVRAGYPTVCRIAVHPDRSQAVVEVELYRDVYRMMLFDREDGEWKNTRTIRTWIR
ncbi:hypothetical protein KQI65_13870 [bacterium]|nr:hypothetical protein [bacterium]